MVESLATCLTQVQVSPHCVMTHANLKLLKACEGPYQVEAKIVKQTHKRVQIECVARVNQHLVAVLEVRLRFESVSPMTKVQPPVDWHWGYRFSKQEIYDFSNRINDQNPIHLNEKPIVQGLLLLQKIHESLQQPKQLQLKFLKPVYANELLYLKREKNSLEGYSAAGLCLKGSY